MTALDPIARVAFKKLCELAGSDDQEVADAAISYLLRGVFEGEVTFSRPLSADQQRFLRGLFSTAGLERSLH